MFVPPPTPLPCAHSSSFLYVQRRFLSTADEHEAARQDVQKGREGAEATGGKGEWVGGHHRGDAAKSIH